MKKITLLLVITLITFVSQVQGQVGDLDAGGYGFFNAATPGTWKIKLLEQIGGEELFLTVNNELKAVWTSEMTGDNPAQLWVITSNHPTLDQDGNAYSYITSAVPNIGVLKADVNTDATPDVIVGTSTGLDSEQSAWQFRKFHQSEPDFTKNSELAGQNTIFLQGSREGTPWESANNAIRLGVTVEKDATIQLDGSAYALRFKLIEAATASVNTFGLDAFTVFTSSNDQLTIKGATSKVKEVSLYSVLGKKVLSKTVNNANGEINININSLSTGLYIVEINGNNGERLTKKVIKQ
ncbi:T9SS type A sorting domain-containing protein [uncultured Polaribacter sp.]|uniref:T9SS type A sorting domain-containing protein n=1 Tax=uncultured Polaribacter sp. TaxID=174711 RepID=UPI002636C19A|nr:T9SS type A sorting domain-containing protein [uncultured Polaribacter sp.]